MPFIGLMFWFEVLMLLAALLVLVLLVFKKDTTSKIQDELKEEESRAHVLASQKAFNEKNCLRCCASFNFLFRKRLLCSSCRFFVCRDCATWNAPDRIWLCKFCEKKRVFHIQTCLNKRLPPNGLRSRQRTRSANSSSSKAAASSYKNKDVGDSDLEDVESDSGYDQSLSVDSRGSSVKLRDPMRGLFGTDQSPAGISHCNGTDKEGNFVPASRRSVDVSALEDEENVPIDPQILEIRDHIETLVEKIISNNLENANLHPLYNHPEYDRMFHSYHGRLSEALAQLGFSLYMAVTNRPLSDGETPTCAHSVLKQIVCEVLEEAMGLPFLNGSETGSMATSSPSFSSDNELNDLLRLQSYEDILATAILNKVIKQYQNRFKQNKKFPSQQEIVLASFVNGENFPKIEKKRFSSSDKEIQTEDETDNDLSSCQGTQYDMKQSGAASDIGSESAGDDFSWDDRTKEYTIEEKIEEITTTVEESESDSDWSRKRPVPMPRKTVQEPFVMKTLMTRDMSLTELDFLYSDLNFNESYKVPFPELGLDIVEGNITDRNGDTSNGKDISILLSTSDNWQDNWSFRKKALLQAYRNMRGRLVTCTEPVPMLVPNPVDYARTRIGSRDIDELSELSERHSINSVEFSSSSDTESDDDVHNSTEMNPKIHHLTEEITLYYAEDLDNENACMRNSKPSHPVFANSEKNCNNGLHELNNLNKTDSRPVPLPRKTTSSINPKTDSHYVSYIKSGASSKSSESSVSQQSDAQSDTDFNSLATVSCSETFSDICLIQKCPSIKFIPVALRGMPPQDLKFTSPPESIIVHRGRAARFHCAINSQDACDVAWFFGMDQLSNDRHYRIFKTDHMAFFQIYDTDISDQGTYSCLLYHQNGQLWADFTLTVRGSVQALKAPHFVEPLKNEVAYEGDAVSLACKVIGHPEPQVFWYYNGQEITLGNHSYKLEILNHGYWILHILQASLQNQGDYSAKAVNRIGDASCEAFLTIAPSGTKELQCLTRKMNSAQDNVHEEAEKLLKSANQLSCLSYQLDQIDHTIDQLEIRFQERTWEERQNEIRQDSLHLHLLEENTTSAIREITGQALDIFVSTNSIKGSDKESSLKSNDDIMLPAKPGTIAEREHKKWLNATASIPNNPYSPENLTKRATTLLQRNTFGTRQQALKEHFGPNEMDSVEESSKINCGLKTIDTRRYTRDYYVNQNDKQLKEEGISSKSKTLLSPIESQNGQATLNSVEEKVYLTAGKLTGLEEKITKLELQVANVKDDTASRKVDVLEDRVAYAAAQVFQSEKQVSLVESNVAKIQQAMENQEQKNVQNLSLCQSLPHCQPKMISAVNDGVSESKLRVSSTERAPLQTNKNHLKRTTSLENLKVSLRPHFVQTRPTWQKPLTKTLSASVSCLDKQEKVVRNHISNSRCSPNSPSDEDLPSLPSVRQLANHFQSLDKRVSNSKPETSKTAISVINIFPQVPSPAKMEVRNRLANGKNNNQHENNCVEVSDEISSHSSKPEKRNTLQKLLINSEKVSVHEIKRKFSFDNSLLSSNGSAYQNSGSPVRRVHSLTARTLSKEFREQAKINLPRQMNRHMSVCLDFDSESSFSSCLPSPENIQVVEKMSSKKHNAACRHHSGVRNIGRNNLPPVTNSLWNQSAETDGHGYTSDESNASTNSLLHRCNNSGSILRRAAYWARRAEEGLTSDNSLNEDFSQAFSS